MANAPVSNFPSLSFFYRQEKNSLTLTSTFVITVMYNVSSRISSQSAPHATSYSLSVQPTQCCVQVISTLFLMSSSLSSSSRTGNMRKRIKTFYLLPPSTRSKWMRSEGKLAFQVCLLASVLTWRVLDLFTPSLVPLLRSLDSNMYSQVCVVWSGAWWWRRGKQVIIVIWSLLESLSLSKIDAHELLSLPGFNGKKTEKISWLCSFVNFLLFPRIFPHTHVYVCIPLVLSMAKEKECTRQ